MASYCSKFCLHCAIIAQCMCAINLRPSPFLLKSSIAIHTTIGNHSLFSDILLSSCCACLCFQAFGTMGILFPLVIPTICELESASGAQCRVDIIIQAAAAIMASSIFGNGKIKIDEHTVFTCTLFGLSD